MSVKIKTLLISIINFLLIIVLTFTVFSIIVFNYINKIETQHLNNDFEVVQALLNREEIAMNKTVLDWAHWDDSYNFLSGENKQIFIETNLQDATLKQLNLNFMFFTDIQGNMVYSITNGLESETKDLLAKKLFNKERNLNPVINFKNNTEAHSGILSVYGKLFIITASPITTTDEKSKSNGRLIIGRAVDDSLIDYINSIIKAKFEFKEIINSNEASNDTIKKNNDYVILYKPMKDIYEDISIGSSISMKRDYYNPDKFYLGVMILILFITLILIFFTHIIIFNKYILKRLKTLNEFIDNVAITKNMKARIDICGNDEIKNIGNATNRMLSELESAYKDIFILSYSDKLTGLKNRVFMEKKFEELDKQGNINYSIIMGDVNGLKLVNATFGHKEGDRLLCKVGNILRSICSKDDVIARWGGDEFTILIMDKEYPYLLNLMKDIKNECEKVTDFSFKISIALGSAKKDDGINSEEVMNLSEERMYRSKLTEVKSSRNGTIMSLERTLYEKHSETEEHTQRIKELSGKLGKKINLSQDKLNELELLSLLHDIGKIGIPEHILMKPGKLTDEEWEIMKSHTEIGYRIAKATPELSHVANEILCHHEKVDGTGYPQGLKGEEIPVLSRIISIVDSFDVMTHKRVYKDASSINYAIEELKRCSGTQFDPLMVDKFIKLLEEDSINLVAKTTQ